MGKYTMVEHHYDENTKRTYIVLKEPTWGGLSSKEHTFIDSGYEFTQSKMQAFLTYPEMIQIKAGNPLTEILDGYLKSIRFERTGKINLQ